MYLLSGLEFIKKEAWMNSCRSMTVESLDFDSFVYLWNLFYLHLDAYFSGFEFLLFANCIFSIQTVRGKCFEKCITKPGSSLSGSESSCISRCVDRYIEATGIIGRSLFNAQR